jgi:hypothetical protein
MALIQTTPKQSGTEGLLKILQVITDGIKLMQGNVLVGQFAARNALFTKLSLYLTDNTHDAMGERNVFIQDVRGQVLVAIGRNWLDRFPSNQCRSYPLTKLDQAAMDIRDYLLFGQLFDHAPRSNDLLITASRMDGKYAVFDILATFTPTD